jgi:hypothetical protein
MGAIFSKNVAYNKHAKKNRKIKAAKEISSIVIDHYRSERSIPK